MKEPINMGTLDPQQRLDVARGQPAPSVAGIDVAVVMPPQCTDKSRHVKYRNGWNSCLSEVVRLNRAQSIPANWKLVPVKPTIDMVEAGFEASLGMPDRSGSARTIEMFDAMLSAAPVPPVRVYGCAAFAHKLNEQFGAAWQRTQASPAPSADGGKVESDEVGRLREALERAETYVQTAFSRAQAKDPLGRKLPVDHPISVDLALVQAALSAHCGEGERG